MEFFMKQYICISKMMEGYFMCHEMAVCYMKKKSKRVSVANWRIYIP